MTKKFKFEIKANVTAATMFTAEIDVKFEKESEPVKLGEAVKQAVSAKANLYGANLYGADLCGANLYGANLGDGKTLCGKRPFLSLGPLGIHDEYVMAYMTSQGPIVVAIGYSGSLSGFKSHVRTAYADRRDILTYLAAVQFIEAQFHAYPATDSDLHKNVAAAE